MYSRLEPYFRHYFEENCHRYCYVSGRVLKMAMFKITNFKWHANVIKFIFIVQQMTQHLQCVWVEFMTMQRFLFSPTQNSKWDGTRIIFNLKSLYNVYVCNVCVLFQMLATVCAETHRILLLENDLVKRFIWNTFIVIFLHFYFAIEFILWLLFYHFFKGSFELTNKPYIKTSSASFYLERFPLGSCTIRPWWFSLFCTLFHYFRFALSTSPSFEAYTHAHFPQTFSFYFLLVWFPLHYIPFHFKCTEKCFSIWW